MRITICIIMTLVLFSCQNVKDGEEKPNIIFVMTDDQSWNLLDDDRYSFLETPNLDKLSREGVVFQNAFVTTSLCSPSRACCISGCYAHKHGVYVNTYQDPLPDVPNVAAILQEAGYATAFVGKWHMERNANPRPGFDYWLSFKGQGEYFDPHLNENGRDFQESGYMTDILTNYALRWIDQERDKPFCVFLWHKAVHAPFLPAPEDSTAYEDVEILEYDNWYDTFEGKPEWLRRGWLYGVHNKPWFESEGKPVPDKIEPNSWDRKNPRWINYMEAMLAVDRSYGRIYSKLDEIGILDNTVIICTSDNGYLLGSHQRGDKRLMYEESIRIPLTIRYPEKFTPGTKETGMVLNIDFAPTILDLAGLPVENDMHGNSIVNLIDKSRSDEWRKSFLYEYFQEAYAPGLVTMNGVRTETYKYIEFPDLKNDINELYDLKNDPGEMNNLILDPKYGDILDMMKSELNLLKEKMDYVKPIIVE